MQKGICWKVVLVVNVVEVGVVVLVGAVAVLYTLAKQIGSTSTFSTTPTNNN